MTGRDRCKVHQPSTSCRCGKVNGAARRAPASDRKRGWTRRKRTGRGCARTAKRRGWFEIPRGLFDRPCGTRPRNISALRGELFNFPLKKSQLANAPNQYTRQTIPVSTFPPWWCLQTAVSCASTLEGSKGARFPKESRRASESSSSNSISPATNYRWSGAWGEIESLRLISLTRAMATEPINRWKISVPSRTRRSETTRDRVRNSIRKDATAGWIIDSVSW